MLATRISGPKPISVMTIGIIATGGMPRKKWMVGSNIQRMVGIIASTKPITTPAAIPTRNPVNRLPMLSSTSDWK